LSFLLSIRRAQRQAGYSFALLTWFPEGSEGICATCRSAASLRDRIPGGPAVITSRTRRENHVGSEEREEARGSQPGGSGPFRRRRPAPGHRPLHHVVHGDGTPGGDA